MLIAFAVVGCGRRDHTANLGRKSPDFPDKEVCSLACGVDWDTYTKVSGQFDGTGWHAKVGDEVNWVISDQPSGRYRFDGLYSIGDGIRRIEMRLNDRVLVGSMVADGEEHTFRISKDEYVTGGDIISVRVLETAGDGYIRSMQPSGVH